MFAGELDAVREATSEGVRLSREAGDEYVLEIMLMELAFTFLFSGDADGSRPLYTEALQIARRIDDRLPPSYLMAPFGHPPPPSHHPRPAPPPPGAPRPTR